MYMQISQKFSKCFRYMFYRTPIPSSPEAITLERTGSAEGIFRIKKNWLRKSESGLWEMYLEGDGFERGAIAGKLTAELAEKKEKAFTDQINKMIPSKWIQFYLKAIIIFFTRHLKKHIPEEYLQEIYGASLSASDKFDTIAPKFYRALLYHSAHDIGHVLSNKVIVAGCTSFGVWSEKSADGALLIGRNFDFYAGDAFAEEKLVSFINSKFGYKFMSISWVGMVGVVSGMNERGLTITINAAESKLPKTAATPISILAREILQYAKNIDEALVIAKSRKTFVSESLMIGSAEDGKVILIEKTPLQIELFETEQQGYVTCTNHYQSKSFLKDKINRDNIEKSASLYRFTRLNQLLSKYSKIDIVEAAEILRDQKGIDDCNIGLGNEKTLNSLVAHHAVIFKPNELKAWVSTAPFQLGKFVCYDLNKIFFETPLQNENKEIYELNQTIAEDGFLNQKEFTNYLEYKRECEKIKNSLKQKPQIVLSSSDISNFTSLNPEYFETYLTIGKYFEQGGQAKEAIKYFNLALTKETPRIEDREGLQNRIIKLTKNG